MFLIKRIRIFICYKLLSKMLDIKMVEREREREREFLFNIIKFIFVTLKIFYKLHVSHKKN